MNNNRAKKQFRKKRRPGIRCGRTWNASRTPPKSILRAAWPPRKPMWAWAIIQTWHQMQQQQQRPPRPGNAFYSRIRRPRWKALCIRNRCTSGPIWYEL